MAKFTKAEIVANLNGQRDSGRAIYNALCGSGITAKMAARGGADLISTFILAHFRMQGLSSMAGYLPIGAVMVERNMSRRCEKQQNGWKGLSWASSCH